MPFIYLNPSASSFTTHSTNLYEEIQSFHQQLPHFKPTPLAPLPDLARELNIKSLFVKDESSRCNLPAFKILGASWATYRSITSLASLPLTTPLSQLSHVAQERQLSLYTATDGNHGRAIARMAALLAIPAHIYVPKFSDAETRAKIASESPNVTVHGTEGDYDAAVATAYAASQRDPRNLFVEDTAFGDYEVVPGWCVEGYSTLLREIEDVGVRPTHVVVPIGCGGLGHAVVGFAKSDGRLVKVIAIEPEPAACLYVSLGAGEMRTIQTGETIMDGMNCGSVSSVSWGVLKEGVDASLTVGERECHDAVQYLQVNGVNAGPCGAGTLAGLRTITADKDAVAALGINEESVVVLLSTEGKRGYQMPE